MKINYNSELESRIDNEKVSVNFLCRNCNKSSSIKLCPSI